LAKFFLRLLRRVDLTQLICAGLSAIIISACSDEDANPSTQQVRVHGAGERPNIVLLLFDDAGYSDMSAFGGEIQTPNIERISREGITVTRFYTAARCSPTRAGILTGHHPHDVGMADLAGANFKTEFSAFQGQLPLKIPLLSELLQDAGYKTYMQGKWHLGTIPNAASVASPVPAPISRGFDEFIGFLSGQAAPYPPTSHRPFQHNEKIIEFEEGWFSIAGMNELMMQQLELQFQQEPETPFFIYIASQSPHEPLQAPNALVEKYRKVYERPLEDLWMDRVSRMRSMGLFPPEAPVIAPKFTDEATAQIRSVAATRAAMIEAADTELGKLLALLEEHGKLDNTLVVITSDNGASTSSSGLTNAPFQGAKGTLGEGGTLAPLVARWPRGRIEFDTVADDMATYLDLMPTFLDAAGVSYPATWLPGTRLNALEGRSLIPMFRGGRLSPPEYFYWNLDGHFALLYKGRWKLSSPYNALHERSNTAPVAALYDLQSDPAETTNVADREVSTVTRLLKVYRHWADAHGAVPRFLVLDAYQKNRAANAQALLDLLESMQREKNALPAN